MPSALPSQHMTRADHARRRAKILDLKRQGLTHVEVAFRLHISHASVATAVARARKLGEIASTGYEPAPTSPEPVQDPSPRAELPGRETLF